MNTLPSDLAQGVRDVAERAGRGILELYECDLEVRRKPDQSPVTDADLAAHAVIAVGLAALLPLPLLSEEAAAPPFEERRRWRRFWLVDPLDGTSGFIRRTGDFAVSIALVEAGRPTLGVIHVPITGETYWASAGGGAYKARRASTPRRIRTRPCPPGALTVATSRSRRNPRTTAFVESLGPATLLRRGSAIKSCLVAEGRADVYPGFSPTSEWDTAAAQCILEAAGGALLALDLTPLEYNARESLENPPFLAVGDPGAPWGAHLLRSS